MGNGSALTARGRPVCIRGQVLSFQSRFRDTKKLLWLLYAVVMVGVIFWLYPRSQPMVDLEVRFLGYTNSPTGSRMVRLGVRNPNSFPIVNSYSAYVENPAVTSPLTVAMTGMQHWVTVPANEEAMVLLPPPAATNAYRVKLGYTRHESRFNHLVDALQRAAGFQTSTTVYTVTSPIIEP